MTNPTGEHKRRILDDYRVDVPNRPGSAVTVVGASTSSGIEKLALPSGLFLYRYRTGSYPPNVQEHDRLSHFLGSLISKLMVATGTRLQPFICIDGRHLDDDFFARLRESGTTWRPLMGFPVIPGVHPFRYLPIAYHISGREAWNEISDRFLGTGAIAIYLTSLASDEFLVRLIQMLFVRDARGSTSVLPVFLPEVMIGHLGQASTPSIKPMLEGFQFFVGENPSASSVDIISKVEIGEFVTAAFEK